MVEVKAAVSPSEVSLAESGDTVIAAATCSTTTGAVALRFSKDAVSVPEPFATAVTRPSASTVKTSVSLLDKVAAPGASAPFASVMVAVKLSVSPREDSLPGIGREDDQDRHLRDDHRGRRAEVLKRRGECAGAVADRGRDALGRHREDGHITARPGDGLVIGLAVLVGDSGGEGRRLSQGTTGSPMWVRR